MYLVIAAGLVFAIVVWRANAGQRRLKLLSRIRSEWRNEIDKARDMTAIAGYHRDMTGPASASDEVKSLDDRTWQDLNLDAVFQVIDRTESTLGQQALYHRLRSIPVADHLDEFDVLVTKLSDEDTTREQAQVVLAPLRHPAGYNLSGLTQPDVLQTRAWHIVFPLVAVGMLVCTALIFVWPRAFLFLIGGVCFNVLVRIATAKRIGMVLGSFRMIGPLLVAAEALRFLPRDGIEAITAPLHEDLPFLRRLKMLARWVSRDPLAADDLSTAVFEYFNLFFLLDANALYFSARELKAHSSKLMRVIAAVGDVDAAISVASFRAGAVAWTRPRFMSAGSPLCVSDLTHPLVKNAVSNSIELGPPNGVLVTGSNMSGKSTFLRTLGVNAILAQTIKTCFASNYQAPSILVRSCIDTTDDLLSGKSYYLVEVEGIVALVRASQRAEPHLFLLDELFKGTNAVERIAAAEAVLAELLATSIRPMPHIVVAATHDRELVDLLAGSYEAYHFADKIDSTGLVFEYRLEKGAATTRNAIALLELSGAPKQLVARAIARATQLDLQRAVTTPI